MKAWRYKNALMSAVALALGTAFAVPAALAAKPGGETAGNNLSFPVIWAEGVEKALPGTPGMIPILDGEWWYWWGTVGTDPNIEPLSCAPDPDDPNKCDDGMEGQATGDDVPFSDPELVKAYLQKDLGNLWQAESFSMADGLGGFFAPVNVDRIDWGDNLESVDWYTRSQVRTEVVLFEDQNEGDAEGIFPMLEYEMRHTSGWGINEVHGLAASLSDEPYTLEGPRATVYSHCARLTIQLLLVDRDDPRLADLVWVSGEGWTEPEGYPDDLINPHIFNGSVHEGGDGPGYYSAEINVKGRIIYGYTWSVRKLHDNTLNEKGAGNYRITFSFDESCGAVDLNTYFVDGVTEIIVPLEEELEAAAIEAAMSDPQIARTLITAAEAEESEGGGAVGVLDFDNNLTYMDVRILERSGGGGGGGHGGGGGSGGGGGGGGGGGHGRK